jgi:transcriptional regulator with XRE-family HTH domain
MNNFSDLLRQCRTFHHLTQQELVFQLLEFSTDFEGLNPVTLSRWETGKTTTSLKRKRSLLKFFNARGWFRQGICRQRVRERFDQLYLPLSNALTHHYDSLIGNLPKLKVGIQEYHLDNPALRQEPAAAIEHIIDIEIASNPGDYYTVTEETLTRWCQHPASFCIACERKSQHLGHFIMLKLKNNVAEQLVHNRINEHSITQNDFCRADENGTYYIHALYGINPTIAAIVNVKAYIFMFENIQFIDNIAIFSSRKDGLRLARDYGMQLVDKGKNNEHHFSWHGLLSPVENILFSDTVLRLVF